ncbi:MAG: hypothetical protein BGO05_14195 [Rhizobiales bacterium 63-7]|nr:hypothetical protein [Hyphomicrobiales bacterium]OJU72405.1 MAG: hypothetical protein BGO05_14195 [Rhizobiales bacterium 63-7]
MPIECPADIVSHLAQKMTDQGTSPRKLAQLTGVPENRLELIQADDWEELTICEIAAISEALDVDLCMLITGRLG